MSYSLPCSFTNLDRTSIRDVFPVLGRRWECMVESNFSATSFCQGLSSYPGYIFLNHTSNVITFLLLKSPASFDVIRPLTWNSLKWMAFRWITPTDQRAQARSRMLRCGWSYPSLNLLFQRIPSATSTRRIYRRPCKHGLCCTPGRRGLCAFPGFRSFFD